MSIPTGIAAPRRRRAPEEAKEEALISARRLLLDRGPDGVTLKAVADDIGMSHGNLIHHFGSAAGLHSALMGAMVRDLTVALESAVTKVRSEDSGPRELVDIVFEAFDSGGAGHLAAWISLSHDLGQLAAESNGFFTEFRDEVVSVKTGLTAFVDHIATPGPDLVP